MRFDDKIRKPEVDELFEAIMALENLDEFYRFFQDLCTVTEIQTMAQRFKAAQLLYNGAKYEEVVEETGMSSATISRIKRFLNYGSDGYLVAIEKLKEDDQTDSK